MHRIRIHYNEDPDPCRSQASAVSGFRGKKNKPNFSKNRPINIHNGMKNFDESVIFLLFDLLDPDPGVSHNADPDPE